MTHPAQPVPASGTSPGLALNVLFNGPLYYLAEIADSQSGSLGFEVVNKRTGHGAFLDGAVAQKMRTSFHALVLGHGGQVSVEQIEEFIGDYDALLMQRVVYH